MGYENCGRRPQPTALKVLRGNPGKRKPNPAEPKPPDGDVLKPSGLSAGAQVMWDELAPVCLVMGTLTVADVRPFAVLCELQASMNEIWSAKDHKGHLFSLRSEHADDKGEVIVFVDNLLKAERDTAASLKSYYEYFGLTPSSRARISVPAKKSDEPVSKWAGALK